jgi:hypothetical protein
MAIFIGRGWLGKQEAQEKGYDSWKRFCHNFKYFWSFQWVKKAK